MTIKSIQIKAKQAPSDGEYAFRANGLANLVVADHF